MAAARANAGDGAFGWLRKREPEQWGEAREAGEWARGCWASPGADRLEGEAASTKQEVEARARARRHASASRQRLKTAVPLVGWAAKWTGQVGCPGECQVKTLSLFKFVSVFYCLPLF